MTDAELLAAYKQCALSEAQLDHRTHVKLGFLLLQAHSFNEALASLRETLPVINARLGKPEGPLEGYNETTTHAFLQLIRVTMDAYREMMPAANAHAFCEAHPQLMSKHALRLFYSPERRQHPDAKIRFVEPDLAPLPVSNSVPPAPH